MNQRESLIFGGLTEMVRVGRRLAPAYIGARDPGRQGTLERREHAAALARVASEQLDLEERIRALGWWPCKDPKKWARFMRRLNKSREEQLSLEARGPA
jgi:hypothetical protein